jgi:hypothetical protein
MYSLTRIGMLGFAAATALTLTTPGSPARADELPQSLGPVGPNQTIMTTFGSKGIIAFYVPDGRQCGLNVVVWNRADESGGSAAGVRVSLSARQVVSFDSPDNQTLNLQCGDYAETLRIVDPKTLIAAGAAQ